MQADIEELVRLGVRACITETPTSEIKLRAYGFSRQQARERATKAVRWAKQHGLKVAFFAVDATRSELEFLKSVYQAVLEAEADEIVVVDTLGACSPEAAEFLVGQVRDWIGPRVPLHFHGHND
ncbi:homoaconitate hydratase, partial [Acidobacteriia bacterium AH_259_A11_L15]|nr:homoaconitate hydratase [Acidobacteriia bacterium AH_259_A11_L15]